ncbi:alpha/beta hydrolase [Candidatus Thorarchaeota archaeon]|nr:MAG: alpha/beta hydrolase [Candidatus Thorarchaeota archaeon]
MQYEETNYIGYDGTHMFMALWKPDDDKPRALLIVLHGLGSHAGDFKNLGEYFANRGLAVFIPDLRGFGHYSGIMGHVMRFDEYIEDIQNLVMQVKDRYLNKITFLFGSSLGGVNAIRYVKTYPKTVDGLILHCPAVSQTLGIGKGTRVAGQILSWLNVKKYFSSGLNYEDASRNPSVIKEHETDPLRFDDVTPRFGIEGLKASEDAFNSASMIKMPVLLQQAGEDKLVSPNRSKEFFENLLSEDKTWHLYEGLYHELHVEPESAQVLGDMENWLAKRLPT